MHGDLPAAIGMALFSTMVSAAVAALLSPIRGAVSIVQEIPVVAIGGMAGAIAVAMAGTANPETTFVRSWRQRCSPRSRPNSSRSPRTLPAGQADPVRTVSGNRRLSRGYRLADLSGRCQRHCRYAGGTCRIRDTVDAREGRGRPPVHWRGGASRRALEERAQSSDRQLRRHSALQPRRPPDRPDFGYAS